MTHPASSDNNLWVAISRGDEQTVEDLIEAGARTDELDGFGNTILHRAVLCGHLGVASLLLDLRALPIDVRSSYGHTPLHHAVRQGSPMMRMLIERGADIEARCNEGNTPLLTAATITLIDPVRELISHGADATARNHEGQNAFDLASIQPHTDMSEWLLQQYPSLAPTGDALDKAMVEAVRHGRTQLVAKLAELGADLAQKCDGRTLIQIAPRDRHDVKRLLRALRTEATIASAMGAESDEPPPASTSATL